MMRGLRTFAADRRGLAAMEFALIAPILVAMLVLGVDGWLKGTQTSQVRTAIHSASRYYETGGNDDTVASAVAVAAWPGKPADGSMNVVRACACGTAPASCSVLCTGNNPPSAYITMTGAGTYSGLVHSHAILESEVVRVR